MVPTAVGLCQYDLSRRVYRLRTAEATHVLRLHGALPLLQDADAHQAYPFHAQLMMAIRLTRGLPLPPVLRDPLCRADLAHQPDRAPRLLDLCHQVAPGCLPHVRQHESAAERFLDFRL